MIIELPLVRWKQPIDPYPYFAMNRKLDRDADGVVYINPEHIISMQANHDNDFTSIVIACGHHVDNFQIALLPREVLDRITDKSTIDRDEVVSIIAGNKNP